VRPLKERLRARDSLEKWLSFALECLLPIVAAQLIALQTNEEYCLKYIIKVENTVKSTYKEPAN